MNGGVLAVAIVFGLVNFGLGVWSLVDMFNRPEWVWQQSGKSKGGYLAAIIIGFFICGIVCLVASIIYLASVRPVLADIQSRGYGGPGGYGYGQPGGYGPPGGGYGPPPGPPPASPPPPGQWR